MSCVIEFETITEMFDRITEKFLYDHRPMLRYKIDGKYTDISYAEMKSTVDEFAFGLAALGVKRGDNVALISENRPEWVVSDMATMKIGAVNVSIYPTLTPKQIEFILNDASIRYAIVSNQLQMNKLLKIIESVPTLQRIVVITDPGDTDNPHVISFASLIEIGREYRKASPEFVTKEMNRTRPNDIATLIYTSGTTGNPKGVMLTHRNIVSNIQATASVLSFTPSDTILSFLPLCHSYERTAGYYTAMSCGVTIAYAESIDTVRENLIEVQPTFVTTVPRLFERIYNRLMKQMSAESVVRRKIFSWAIAIGRTYKFAQRNNVRTPLLTLQYKLADKLVFQKIRSRIGGRLKYFASGGAALAPELGEFFEAVGILIIEGYGMTESSPIISVNRPEDYKFGTVGKPIPGVEVRIAPDGEILARGPNVMKGYWNNEQATDDILDPDGWLHTGDIGLLDAEGHLKITDRKKHLFVSSGGKNIAPQHIENLFLQSEYIDQFVLIGDGRMYLTALVVPNFELLRSFAAKQNILFTTHEELSRHPEIYSLFDQELRDRQKDLANYERVRKFTILSRPFTVENDELTPTLKVKRKVIEERFRDEIEKMYEGIK
jgi:long-chain acyl-CoA synthetase